MSRFFLAAIVLLAAAPAQCTFPARRLPVHNARRAALSVRGGAIDAAAPSAPGAVAPAAVTEEAAVDAVAELPSTTEPSSAARGVAARGGFLAALPPLPPGAKLMIGAGGIYASFM